MSEVFVSYVLEVRACVDRLKADLERSGTLTWVDRDRLRAGDDWPSAIHEAIRNGSYFIACFSRNSHALESSYMNEELLQAVDALRRRRFRSRWLLPVLFDPVDPPALPLGAGRTLNDLQYARMYEDWETGLRHLLSWVDPQVRAHEREAVLRDLQVPASQDKLVHIWDLETGVALTSIPKLAHVGALAFGPFEGLLAVGTNDGTVRIFDVDAEEPIFDEQHPRGWLAPGVDELQFSPDGRLLAVGYADRTVAVVELDGMREIASRLYPSVVESVAFSPDAGLLATVSASQTACVWDVGSDEGPRVLDQPNVRAIAFHPEGSFLAMGGRDRTLRMWGARTG